MRRWKRSALVAVAPVAVAAGLLAVETVGGAFALGAFPTRVRATFVDADTGQPLPGVAVLTLPRSDWANHPDFIANERRRHAEAPGYRRFGATAAGTSADDGGIDLRLHVRWCERRGPISGLFTRYGPPRYHGVRALLVEKDGYGHAVIDCTNGLWTEHDPRDDLHATLDVGEVRLTRTP